MKKIISLFIILAMTISSIGVFAVETTAPVFSDVDANSTTGQAIYKLVNAGVLNGYTDGTFRQNNPLTRAELCKIVNLVFGYTEAAPDTFTDVTGDGTLLLDQPAGMGQHTHDPLRGGVSAQLPQVQIPVPFAEPAAIGGDQHGHMGILRMGKPKSSCRYI